jgi:hypothetical protein
MFTNKVDLKPYKCRSREIMKVKKQKSSGMEFKEKISKYPADEKKEWIVTLLSKLKEQKSADDIRHQVLSQSEYEGLKDFMPGSLKYPRLRFKLSSDESRFLKDQAIDNHSLLLDACLASGRIKSGVELTPLEKLLYAFLWKQGELGNFHLFLKGFTNSPIRTQDRIVLFEFAKYLTGQNDYILDQHTLRCFAVASSEDQASIEEALRIEKITEKNLGPCIKIYKDFYEHLKLRSGENQERDDFFYEVDRVLFAAGKCLKSSKASGADL